MIAALTVAVMIITGSVAVPAVHDGVTLPVARYDAVIPALDAWPFMTAAATSYSLEGDTDLFDAPGGSAVATLQAKNFLGDPTIVVGVDQVGGWVRVLTPARQKLPSDERPSNGDAAAQTSGWLLRSQLVRPQAMTTSVVISVSAETLTITLDGAPRKTFPVGVGTADAPTPTGVTGYLQARYFDAAQQQASHPVQLTSLHSTAADEPFGGTDGGLIGLHYEKEAAGAVSHGCVRLGAAAATAVDVLPLGTLVTITP
jgi:lipoprotein-anchoring transpeptidase ErfK/SrfK